MFLLGNLACGRGLYSTARDLFEASLQRWRELGNHVQIANVLLNLGHISYIEEHDDHAASLFRESLLIQQAVDVRPGVADCLEGLAILAARHARHHRAIKLAGAAKVLRESGSMRSPSYLFAQRDQVDRVLERVHRAAADGERQTTWLQGHAMSLDQAIEYALSDEPV